MEIYLYISETSTEIDLFDGTMANTLNRCVGIFIYVYAHTYIYIYIVCIDLNIGEYMYDRWGTTSYMLSGAEKKNT